MITSQAFTGRTLDLGWLALLVTVGCVFSAFLATSIFEATVSLSGILCVGLIAIGRREGYLVGLYNSLSYSVVAYQNGLYGEVYLNLLFYVPTGVIGYAMWSRHTMQDRTVKMRKLGPARSIAVLAMCGLGIMGLGFLLGLSPGQNTPYLDASTNVLSLVATFLMMWRYKEQWLLYILVNTITIIMWFLRYIAGGTASDLMILMWSLFLVNSVFGYWRWYMGTKRMAIAEEASLTSRVGTCEEG